VVLNTGHMSPIGPQQISNGPQENDGKSRGHINFAADHRNLAVCIKYFIFKSNSKVPLSTASPKHKKAKLCFIAILTPCLVGSGFSWVNYYWLSKVRKRLDVVSLVTGHTATGHSKSCTVHQAQGARWIKSRLLTEYCYLYKWTVCYT